MYDNYIDKSKFNEIRSLIHDYMEYGKEYSGMSIDEISVRAYQYYEEGRLSDSQYDYLSSMIDDIL
ncbi:MAG: hypothetical protein K2J39_10905 [Ruminococcus sp.]|nr:hypothetical protein [Ruminococcus sp.]